MIQNFQQHPSNRIYLNLQFLQTKVQDNVEERLEHLEEMAKVKVLRSCHELEQHGITKSGT